MNVCWRVLVVAVLLCGCRKAETDSDVPPGPVRVVAPVGAAAYAAAADFVALGAKLAGEESARMGAEYILARLQADGIEAALQVFEDDTPHGKKEFRNVLARIPGKEEGIILLAAHYDTKSGIENFVGANDSGSGVGLLIALAEVLNGQEAYPFESRFAFFDGEECAVHYGPNDGLHGSRHLAQAWEADGDLKRIRAMLLLDMVGDKDLRVTIPRNGSPAVAAQIMRAAREEQVREYFALLSGEVLDDHVPFLVKGVPAVDLIDFAYGSAPGKNDYWHTAEDTLDKISAESLEVVGRVVQRFLLNAAAE